MSQFLRSRRKGRMFGVLWLIMVCLCKEQGSILTLMLPVANSAIIK